MLVRSGHGVLMGIEIGSECAMGCKEAVLVFVRNIGFSWELDEGVAWTTELASIRMRLEAEPR